MGAERCVYKDFYLCCTVSPDEAGTYAAHVAVTTLSGDRTRAQRFLDFDGFATEPLAMATGMARAKDWINVQERERRLSPGGADDGSLFEFPR